MKTTESHSAWRSALALGLVAVIGTGMLAGVHQLSRDRIDEQQRRSVLKQLAQVIAPHQYDNSLHDDYYTFTDLDWFPSGQTVTIYRARFKARPVAAILKLAATDGYNGNINLLIGIYPDGSLSGVRVTTHKETPGLGDAIESNKSDWVFAFSGKSLQNPIVSAWTVKKDKGYFDQFTGATITPRAVVKAVRQALFFYSANQEQIFAHVSDPSDSS